MTAHLEIPHDLFHKVLDFFDGDAVKAGAWWLHDNPNLGGISPTRMIMLGREKKLRKWITLQLSDQPTKKKGIK